MSQLWSAKEAAQALGIEPQGDWIAMGISIDTRTLQEGDIFFALTGEFGNGHDYVAQAIEKGAACVVISQDCPVIPEEKTLKVGDTLEAMQKLGIAARARTGAKILGITGNVGKTGTKEIAAQIFADQGQTHASIKSYNNHWGVPYTLASMDAGTDYGVFEMGMNHPNEIRPLAKMVQPDIAIITHIPEQPVHMENFENGAQGVVDAKAEIFEGVKEGGTVLLNRDDFCFDYLKGKAQAQGLTVFTFGDSHKADAILLDCLVASNGSKAKVRLLEEEIEFFLPLSGHHHAKNALAVLLASRLMNLDMGKAIASLAKLKPVAGRGTREYLDIGEKDNPVTLIDESYNASPAAMNAAFKVLALIDPGRGGRRIAVLGDMLELGPKSGDIHADLSLPIQAADINLVYTCGKNMKRLHEALPANQQKVHKKTSAELAQIVPDVLIPGDVVMVKGSLGSKMGLVVEALRQLPHKLKQNNKG